MIWPFRDLPAEHAAFVAVNRLAARGGLPLGERDVDFKPDEPATVAWRQQVMDLSLQGKLVRETPALPAGDMTRGEFCRRWWEQVKSIPDVPFVRASKDDADEDGIPDHDDPSLFTPGDPIVWSVAGPSPDQDGLPDNFARNEEGVRYFNFTGTGSKQLAGFASDFGLPFDNERGYGWDRDLSANNRRRNVYAEAQRDTFLFTRDAARWECVVANGRWLVTICAGDSGHDQTGHRIAFEGKTAIEDEPTPAGLFIERTVTVDVRDGRLTMDLGPQSPGNNTCVNWIRLQRQ